ncbi:MAG TPA: PAS domain S-box protein [Pyrinomonadaceae bacterium]|jgi:two-component system CheB/CheR fusion protein
MKEDINLNNQDEEPERRTNDFLIVSIGASAGGIKALGEFFERVPANSGMAYVVVLHLSPNHDSRLAEVLQRNAKIPVTQVRKRVSIEPDHVYVISPDKSLAMEGGELALSEITSFEERRAPVDIFFRSLAESHESRAVAVILSGTGTDGSMGIKRVKERGGVCFVQDPSEAEYDEMPRSSLATDLMDGAFKAAEIPAQILAYQAHLAQTDIVPQASPPADSEEAVVEKALREIFVLMSKRTGHDFSNYKRHTLLRRIERRINVRQLPDLPAYARYLREETEETSHLLRDLLISVTNFFRDKEAFLKLESDVLPKVFHGKTAKDAVRVWIAGCATGEEAYSLAMLLQERAASAGANAPAIQIFATDIDERAIAHARRGLYTETDAADVPPERLRRFFTKEANGYRVRREIRESVLFAVHNVIKDPPFLRLDLVTCRNLLIYLDRAAQRRVIGTFNYALDPHGFLFLGSSESLEQLNDGFMTFDKDSRLFQRRSSIGAPRAFSIPDLPPALNLDLSRVEPSPFKQPNETLPVAARSLFEQTPLVIHQKLLERYAPPSIVVGENYEVIHISENAARFMQISSGEPSRDLLQLIRPELRSELRAALFQAAQRKTNVEIRGVKVGENGKSEVINLIVSPAFEEEDSAARGCFLIIFEEAKDASANDADAETIAPNFARAEQINPGEVALNAPLERQYEEELSRVRSNLRSTVEQYEVQNEEMKASNEELQAMNEELRSASEELEASKEELQSLNEELSTVNQELKIKIEDLSHANSDFQNLMSATSIATIFLDRSLNIKHFTPPAQEIFNILPVDLGRPLANLTGKIADPNLHTDVERVLSTLQTVEREVATTENRSYLMQLLPYRTLDDRISGVVLSFVDITARKQAEEAKFYLASIVESSEDSMLTVDLGGTITSWNKASEDLYGYPASEVVGKPLTMLTLPADLAEVVRNADKIANNQQVEIYDTIRVNKDGREMNLEVVLSPVKNSSGAIIGVSTVARDVTERRLAQAAKYHLAAIVESSQDSMVSINLEGVITSWNRAAEQLYGYPAAEAIGKALTELTLPQNLLEVLVNIENVKNSQKVEVFDSVRLHKDSHEIHLEVVMSPIKDETGRVIGVSTMARDVTERRRAVEALRESEEKYRTLFETIDEGYLMSEVIFDENEKPVDILYLEANPAAIRLAGRDFIGRRMREIDPNYEEFWYEIIGRVALTGEAVRAEHYAAPHGRWFDFYAFKVGEPDGRRVASVFQDISERKRSEEALRQSEERKTFLLGLTDALRSLNEPLQVLEEGLKRVGEFLDLERVVYNEIDPDVTTYTTRVNYLKPGFSSVVGSLPMAPFRETVRDLEKGITYVQCDVERDDQLSEAEKQACRRIQVQAFVTVPLVKKGQWVCNLVSHSGKPRDWSEHELTILEESADRLWSAFERAKAEEALRKSEEKYRTLFDSIDEAVAWFEIITDENGNPVDYRLLEVNPAYSNMSGGLIAENSVGKTAKELVPNIEQSWIDTVAKAAFGGESIRVEQHVKDLNSWFQVYVSPVSGKRDGQFVAVYSDITERKRREANLAFLADLMNDFAPLASAEEIMEVTGKRLAEHLKLSRYMFVEIYPEAGTCTYLLPSRPAGQREISGSFILADYHTEEEHRLLSAGHSMVVNDVRDSARSPEQMAAFAAFDIASIVNTPYLSNGRWVFDLGVARSQPSVWREDEIELLREISARLWIRIERARAEQSLRASEERLRVMIENLPGGAAFVLNHDLRYLLAEGEALYAAGFEPADLVGKTIFEALSPNLAASYEPQFRQALAGEEFTHEHEAHGRVYVSRGVPLRDGNGEIYAVLAVSYDITERKKAEKDLRESEERLRLAIEASDLATWEWNLETNEVFWNKQHFLLFGMPPHSNPVKPEEFFNHVHADDRDRIEQALNKAIGERSVFDTDFRAVLDTGETRWMSGYGRVTESEKDKALIMSGVMFDINERRQIEEALRTSSERLRLLVESASDYAIFTMTLDSRIDSWNAGAEKIFGWTEAEAVGQSGAIIFTPEDRENGAPEQEMAAALAEGRAPDERFHIRRDGSRFYASGVMNLLRDAEGNARGFVKICRDITERIEAEKAVRDAEKAVRDKEILQKLVAAQEDERKRISRDLHDELGQQLTALRLKLDHVQKMCDDAELCDKIDEIEHIAKSIDNGVDFLAWELRPAALDDLGLVAALDNYVRQWSHYSGVSAELIVSSLKKTRFAPETETNLYRIVQEALNNTQKHAKAKSVEVMLEKRDDLIVMLIEDDGVGFNAGNKKNSLKGLGLTGMKERAALIGGTLEVESAPGKGTTVFVRVPASSAKGRNSDDE